VFIEADQIELARTAAEVARQDAKPLADEMPFGEPLGRSAANVPGIVGRCHASELAPLSARGSMRVSRVFTQIRAKKRASTWR